MAIAVAAPAVVTTGLVVAAQLVPIGVTRVSVEVSVGRALQASADVVCRGPLADQRCVVQQSDGSGFESATFVVRLSGNCWTAQRTGPPTRLTEDVPPTRATGCVHPHAWNWILPRGIRGTSQ
jgi:hypothetical protein